jgi:hypothetical protein
MLVFKWRIAFGVSASLMCFALAASADIESGVQSLPKRTFVHLESKVSLRVPAGWEIFDPYRLRKTTTSSVLGLEKENPRVAVTIIWSPLGNRPWDEVIRAAADDDRGDEYATLVTVYKKDNIERPITMKVGPYTVFKVLIDGGPDKGDAGALYLFEAGSGGNRWKVKVRAVYPRQNREEYLKQVEEVIANFSMATE